MGSFFSFYPSRQKRQRKEQQQWKNSDGWVSLDRMLETILSLDNLKLFKNYPYLNLYRNSAFVSFLFLYFQVLFHYEQEKENKENKENKEVYLQQSLQMLRFIKKTMDTLMENHKSRKLLKDNLEIKNYTLYTVKGTSKKLSENKNARDYFQEIDEKAKSKPWLQRQIKKVFLKDTISTFIDDILNEMAVQQINT